MSVMVSCLMPLAAAKALWLSDIRRSCRSRSSTSCSTSKGMRSSDASNTEDDTYLQVHCSKLAADKLCAGVHGESCHCQALTGLRSANKTGVLEAMRAPLISANGTMEHALSMQDTLGRGLCLATELLVHHGKVHSTCQQNRQCSMSRQPCKSLQLNSSGAMV